MKDKKPIHLMPFVLLASIIILSGTIIFLLTQINSNLKEQAKISEEKINSLNSDVNVLAQKISGLQSTTAANSALLEKIISGNLTEADKLCNKLNNIKIEKSYYKESILFVKVNNENNQDIEGFSFNLIGENTAKVESNEKLNAFETKEYNFNNVNITKVIATPMVSIDDNLSLCEKQIISEVKKYFDLNGNFNVSSKFIASGQEKNITLLATFTQKENSLTAEAKVLKETGEYGEPFSLLGEIIEDKLTLSGKEVIIPAGSISGVDQDVKADISLSGIIINDNLIEGKNLGDVKLNVKDAIPGVTITVDGSFKADRI